ncbi:MAG: phosphotransferase [Patescibacteria group bacterium]
MLKKQKIPSSILKNILNNFDLGKIKKIKPLATSGNISYIIETNKEKYFLRLSPYGIRWRSKEEILAEIELINYLHKNKFPVSVPLRLKNGKTIVNWEKHYGYIRKLINGKEKINPKTKEIEIFGRTLGFFHKLIENYRTKHKRNHIWDLKQTRKYFEEDKKTILKSRFKNKKEFVSKFKKEISSINFPNNLPSGTIHEDLGKRHIIWRKNLPAGRQGKIIGFIDFDRSYYGKLVLDLGQACRGWCFTNNWQKWSNENFKSLIKGYEKERKLKNIEKEYLIDAIKFGILERGLAFCLRYINVTKDPKDEKYAWHSISDRGLIGMVEKNRGTIEKFLKIA